MDTSPPTVSSVGSVVRIFVFFNKNVLINAWHINYAVYVILWGEGKGEGYGRKFHFEMKKVLVTYLTLHIIYFF